MIVRTSNMAFDDRRGSIPPSWPGARIVGLDIAGVDLVYISKTAGRAARPSSKSTPPGLLMHIKPGVGQPRL